MTKPDSSLVAFSDEKETDRVRENFLKKKLGRTEADSALDAAIAAVGETMKADRTKNRVTVYYLLADKYGSTSLFVKAANTKPKAPAKAVGATAEKKPAAKIATKTTKPATKPKAKTTGSGAAAAAGGAALGLAALGNETSGGARAAANDEGVAAKAGPALGAAGAAVSGAAEKAADAVGDAVGAVGDTAGKAGAAAIGAAGAAAAGVAALAGGAGNAVSGGVDRIGGAASKPASDGDEGGSSWLWWLLFGLLVLFAIWWFFLRGPDMDDSAAAPAASETAAPAASTASGGDLAAAPTEGSVAIPAGAGVTSELRDGKPVVKVYFDTGKTAVVPDFTATAGGLKAWLDSHAGSSLAVSGYADPSGNAALNAALSKKRAQAVQAALVAAGIPEASAALVKPAETTDATVDKAAARRVEVVVR